jgi:hypothetical protein
MKSILTALTIATILLFCQYCSPKPQNGSTTCLEGKLVKRGICGQFVVQLLSNPVDGLVYAPQWTDSMSNKSYENVFTIANPCSFPATIKEGETFSFSITQNTDSPCIQCKAYTPTPSQRNNIITGCK